MIRKAVSLFTILLSFCGVVSAEVALTPYITGLSTPVFMVDRGDGRLFVVQRGGQIKLFINHALVATPFLDISSKIALDGERGLLSMAFDPSFSTNHRFFVYYNRKSDGATVVSSFQVSRSNKNLADPRTEKIRLHFVRPFNNHNGGELLFGPDRYLYIGSGDGGGGGDPFQNGQKLSVLLGKLMRIDVSGATGYKIPKTNPFVRTAGARKEIYAYGLRNPWRFSFDRSTGALYVGDVGQDEVEEIDVVDAGDNLGWNTMEGDQCYPSNVSCDRTGLKLPIATYTHAEGQSVTGGYVYRGKKVSDLRGKYLFADFVNGKLFTLTRQADRSFHRDLLMNTGLAIASFAEDHVGELYVLDYSGGVIYKVTEK